MAIAQVLLVLVLAAAPPPFAQAAPPARDVTLTAADGTPLKATYYAAAQPGPAVLLLHMCNTTRKSWEPLAPQLAAAGIHALAVDYRGFGESGGDRADTLAPQDAQRIITEKWPGDIDKAYEFLLAQPGVNKARVGAAGGSCGVNQAVRFARRHPEVSSLGAARRRARPGGHHLPHGNAMAAHLCGRRSRRPVRRQRARQHAISPGVVGESPEQILRLQGRQARHRDLRPASGAAEADGRLVCRHARHPPRRSQGSGGGERHTGAEVLAEGGDSRRRRRGGAAVLRRGAARRPRRALRRRRAQPAWILPPAGRQAERSDPAVPLEYHRVFDVGEYLRQPRRRLPGQRPERAGPADVGEGAGAAARRIGSSDERKKAIRDSAEQKIAKLKEKK